MDCATGRETHFHILHEMYRLWEALLRSTWGGKGRCGELCVYFPSYPVRRFVSVISHQEIITSLEQEERETAEMQKSRDLHISLT